MDLDVINNKLDFIIANMQEPKENFNAEEAAEYLCLSYDYLMYLVREGKIRHKRKGGPSSPVIFRREWLNEWMDH